MKAIYVMGTLGVADGDRGQAGPFPVHPLRVAIYPSTIQLFSYGYAYADFANIPATPDLDRLSRQVARYAAAEIEMYLAPNSRRTGGVNCS